MLLGMPMLMQCGHTCKDLSVDGLIPSAINLKLPDGSNLFSGFNKMLQAVCEKGFPAYTMVSFCQLLINSVG